MEENNETAVKAAENVSSASHEILKTQDNEEKFDSDEIANKTENVSEETNVAAKEKSETEKIDVKNEDGDKIAESSGLSYEIKESNKVESLTNQENSSAELKSQQAFTVESAGKGKSKNGDVSSLREESKEDVEFAEKIEAEKKQVASAPSHESPTPAAGKKDENPSTKPTESDLFGDSGSESDDSSDNVVATEKNVLNKFKADGDSESSSSDSSSSSEDDRKPSLRKRKRRRLEKGLNRRRTKIKQAASKKRPSSPSSLDKFIDSEDENMDLRKEYEAQKEFDSDEDPYRDDVEEKDEEVEGTEFDRVLKKLKDRNKKKDDGMSEQEREEFVHDFLVKMDKAAEDDNEARSKGKLAVAKLSMLDEVMENLSKRTLQMIFLERNLLQVLGQWLRPSPVDGSLPSLTIRNRIIDLLPQLQIEADHLRRGKFGKVVNYLRECPKETAENRKKLTKLMQSWTRNIFGKSDDFKTVNTSMVDRQSQEKPLSSRKTMNPRINEKPPELALNKIRKLKGNTTTRIGEVVRKSLGNVQYRARIPQPRDFNFSREKLKAFSPETPNVQGNKKSQRKNKLEKKIRLVGKKR